MTVNPRSLGVESDYVTADVVELSLLKGELVESGVPAPKAAGIVGWLVDKAAGAPDTTTAPTRAEYRRVLESLPPRGRTPRVRRARADAGYAAPRTQLVALAGASGAALALSGHPLALVVAPIIFDPPTEDYVESARCARAA